MAIIGIVSDRASQTARNTGLEIARLNAQLRQAVQGLASLGADMPPVSYGGSPFRDTPAGLDLKIDVSSARRLRDLRRKILGDGLDTGPAWDILLHLFESHILCRRDTIGNLTDGTELAPATALRWVSRLDREGLLVTSDDHLDKRRRFVQLSELGVAVMTRYFKGAAPQRIAA